MAEKESDATPPDIPDKEPNEEAYSPVSPPGRGPGKVVEGTEKRVFQPAVLERRMAGDTYKEIAEWLEEEHGVERVPGTIRDWIYDCLQRYAQARQDKTEELVELNRQRLIRQIRVLESNLERIDKELKEADVGTAEPSMLRERRQTVAEMRKLNESLRELHGLDAPEQREVNHEHSVNLEMNLPEPDKPEELADEEAEAIDTEAELIDDEQQSGEDVSCE